MDKWAARSFSNRLSYNLTSFCNHRSRPLLAITETAAFMIFFFCFSDGKARPIFYIQPAKLTHSCMLFEHTLNPYRLSCMLRQHEWLHFLFRHPEVFILYSTNSTHFKTGIFISVHTSFITHPPRQLHYHLNRICLCSHIMFPELCASCPSLTAVHLDF